jgi:hypothetical protein
LECFEPTLATNQVKSIAILAGTPADRYWALKPNRGYVVYDFLVLPFISGAGVQYINT